MKDDKFITMRKIRKLFRNPKLFFRDSLNKRSKKISYYLGRLNNKTEESIDDNQSNSLVLKKSSKLISTSQSLVEKVGSKEKINIDDLTPSQLSSKFLADTKQLYQKQYNGAIYPLLEEAVFKKHQDKLSTFWSPLLTSDLCKGLAYEKDLPKQRNVKKVNLKGNGKIKIAVFTENFHFIRPLYDSPIIKEFVDFREVNYTAISRGFSAQHRKYPTLDHLHSHGQLVARGKCAADINKVFSSFARFFPESYETLQWADIVWSEWWVHPTVWASRYLADNTKLITRCHAYEAFTYWPHFIDFDRVSKNIFVGEHIKDIARDSFENFNGFDERNNHLIRNYVDFSGFDTDKHPDARFTIGMVQWGDMNKDPLFALDVLQKLIRIEPRFRLVFAGRPFAKPKNKIEESYQSMFNEKAAQLSSHIEFSGFVDDMNEWYKKIGYILNCSHRESQSVAVCEGAATGAIPIIKEWSMVDKYHAASKIYPGFVHEGVDDIVYAILENHDNFNDNRLKVVHNFRTEFGLETTAQQTLNLILETMNP